MTHQESPDQPRGFYSNRRRRHGQFYSQCPVPVSAGKALINSLIVIAVIGKNIDSSIFSPVSALSVTVAKSSKTTPSSLRSLGWIQTNGPLADPFHFRSAELRRHRRHCRPVCGCQHDLRTERWRLFHRNEKKVSMLTSNCRTQLRDTRLKSEKDDLATSASSSRPLSSPVTSSLSDIISLVTPLLLVYISNQWSRASIYYLVDFSSSSEGANAASSFRAMNIDLHFTQSEYGLLASTAFTALFALSSLYAGGLADKNDRKFLTLSSCSVWALATLAQSQSQSYAQVLIARIIMGGACAFCVPAAYTLIADKISKDKAALANSIYGSGVYLGGALASLSLLLDERYGWRGALGAIALFGGISVLSAGILLPSDDDRNLFEHEKQMNSDGDVDDPAVQRTLLLPSVFEITLEILSIPRVRYLFLASFFRFSAGLMIGVWAAPYYKQAFPENSSEYAVTNAFIVGLMGMSSGILGGYAADYLGGWIKENKQTNEESSVTTSAISKTSLIRKYFDEQTVRLLIPIIGSILAIPTWYLATHVSTPMESFTPFSSKVNAFELSMFWLATEYLVAECWFGPVIAVLQSSVGVSKTGTAQGLFVLTGAVGNVAPTLLGWIYGNSVRGSQLSSSEVLADLLAWGVCSGYLLSAIFFAFSVGANGDPVVTFDNPKAGEAIELEQET